MSKKKAPIEDAEVKRMKEYLSKNKEVSPPAKTTQKDITPSDKDVPVKRKASRVLNFLGHLLRSLVFDLPLMLLFALYLSTVVLHDISVEYYIPQLKLMRWNKGRQQEELTYYHRTCSEMTITTNDPEDLMINETMDSTECMEHMLHHGVSVYSGILSAATAKAAREYILERNLIEEGFGVIANKNRYSFGVGVNSDPSIQAALKEIGEHKQLQAALRKIVGPNPAVVEFTGITATYGAADQHFHQDVVPKGSAFKYGRNFVPTYSLFIPLQDITAAMGATQVCPGTHQCDGSTDVICDEGGGIFVSGETGTWKSGSGALVNQQLFHRGTAHSDKDGPARTLFILTFASRPRFEKNQVESRQIGQSGSYSLKWNQWGHTLDDFANAPKQMAEPWLTMRALGIYKAPGRDWGWDFPTVAAMRMANFDTGFEEGELETFVGKGGFKFIPDFLKPKLVEDEEWKDYLLRQIISVRDWLKKINVHAVLGYISVIAVFNLFLAMFGFKGRATAFGRAVVRLCFTHGIVFLVVYLVTQKIHSGQWARNIRHGKAYRGYRTPTKVDQPGTLPFATDFLDSARYQTSYLASYTQLLDVNHPGNKNWLHLINDNSINYHNLPLSAKKNLIKVILLEMKVSYSGRLLKQSENGKWVTMSEREQLDRAHTDLTKASSSVYSFVLKHLDYLQGELAAGVFRETSLHRNHVHTLLRSLQHKLIGQIPLHAKPENGAIRVGSKGLQMRCDAFKPQSKAKISRSTATPTIRSIPSTLPPMPDPEPPYPGAWVQEKDVVDGQYKGQYNEWYRGVVSKVNANKGSIDVLYDDGDKDVGLCRLCVRPTVPFTIDEPVAVRKKNVFYDGRIVGIGKNDRYDVDTYKIGLQTNVSASNLRRFNLKLEAGAVVEAKFQGVGDIWYRGRIAKVNKDGSFDINFDDGDKEYGAEAQHIRLAAV